MITIRFIIVFLVLFVMNPSFAQQNNIWYFGRKAALNFNPSKPVPLHNSAMDADEGSASICDNAGNLLFYTNGVTVYNKSHQVMVNGSGLLGNISSVQSSVIVPLPGNANIYYIFTADAIENNFANGYNYSIVDMSLDNGKGEVTSKNVLLATSCTERLAAARHGDGTSTWIITNTRNSNTFSAWLMDCTGLSANPVVSNSGMVMNLHGFMSNGMIKISPDGKHLCQSHYPADNDGTVLPNFCQLFDFNNMTGVISNAITLDPGDAKMTSCEFSSNSKLLYISRAYDNKIDQYDISQPTAATINASRYIINTINEPFYGIALAPDQKIYLASPSPWIGVIKYPNIKGAGCGFVKQGLDVNEQVSGSAYAGMPNFINDLSYDGSNNFNYTILDSCTGTVQFNGITSMSGTIIWNWDFGDGFISNLQNPIHSFSSSSANYPVKLKIQSAAGCGSLDRVKNVIPKGLIMTTGFNFTVICDSGIIRFQNTTSFLPDTSVLQYLWDLGDGTTSTQLNPVHSYPPGNYNVRLTVKTTTVCLDQSVSRQVIMQYLNIQATVDTSINIGDIVQLGSSGGGSQFLWTPTAGLSNAAIANPVARPRKSTLYIVTATNAAGCRDADSVFIKVKPIPGIYVPSGFTPNNDGKNDLLKPYINDDYLLQEFTIFNRWGQKVYSTSEKETGWNGKVRGILQDAAVYIWILSATNTVSGKKEELKGTFVIIR